MTLRKLLAILGYIDAAHASVDDVNMHGSCVTASAGGELAISFNTQPPQSLDAYLKCKGFIVWGGLYIYRPRK